MYYPFSLKPCPFCGNGVFIEKIPLWHGTHGYHGNYDYVIKCNNCGCKIAKSSCDDIYRKEEEAIKSIVEAWNTRYYEEKVEIV